MMGKMRNCTTIIEMSKVSALKLLWGRPLGRNSHNHRSKAEIHPSTASDEIVHRCWFNDLIEDEKVQKRVRSWKMRKDSFVSGFTQNFQWNGDVSRPTCSPLVSPEAPPQGSFMRSSAALQLRPPQDGPVVFPSPPSGLLSGLLSDLILGLLPGLLLCILSLYVNILLVCGSRST